jgi:hypothetical protein
VFLNSETLGTSGSVERCVQAFQHCGYEVLKLRVGSAGKQIAESEWCDHRAEFVMARAYAHRMLRFEASRLADGTIGIRTVAVNAFCRLRPVL